MSGWSTQACESASALWRDGKSGGEIAETLNRAFSDRHYTRGGVLGKLHRLGLVGDGRPTQSVPRKTVAKAASAAAPVKPYGKVAERLASIAASAPQVAPDRPVTISAHDRATAFEDRAGSVSWADLRAGDRRCRWPLDAEDGSTRYCAEDVTDVLTSYCDFHNCMSCGRGTPSERKAHQVSGAAA